MKEKKAVRMGVNHGDAFFCDGVTVSHNPAKFVIDFKQRTPRFDPAGEHGEEQMVLLLKHNVVVMDPELAKSFVESLQDNLKKYEKDHGKIKTKGIKALKGKKAKGKKPFKDAVSANYIG